MERNFKRKDYREVLPKMFAKARKGDMSALEDAFEMIRLLEREDSVYVTKRIGKKEHDELILDETNRKIAHQFNDQVRKISAREFERSENYDAFVLNKKSLQFDAPYDFDAYCRYIEFDRDPEKQFYMPRRKQLKTAVDALQLLGDNKLRLLTISMPPGVGKTTTAIFFLTWEAGRHPDLQNLICSHNNEFLRGVYDECLRIFDADGEYLWSKVFPDIGVCDTNAKSMRIDVGTSKRFETLEFTSKNSGNAGKVRATNILYCDDLVEGIEQAMSREQMDKLWQIYTDDFRQRKQGSFARELHIATRWSVHDPIGRLERSYGDSKDAMFITMSALDENDESNFDYPHHLGYTTQMLHEQRNVMDDASWRALYMNQPIEREGQLYPEDELRRYFSLPVGEPDAIIAVCDTKSSGDDYCFMPIVYQYGADLYIEDCVCENYAPDVVERSLIEKLAKYDVHTARFESNMAGAKVAQTVQEELKKLGKRTHITTKWTTQNKETKIQVDSPFVKQHCLFKDSSVIKGTECKEYRLMMTMLCGYTMAGKNRHDDVPDGLSQLARYVQEIGGETVEIVRRFW